MVDTVKLRRPQLSSGLDEPSGRVSHDDRGNAIWNWSEDIQHQDPLRYAPVFEISDHAEDSRVMTTDTGRRLKVSGKGGYNPYESGLVKHTGQPHKRDLRALSKWIEDRRQRGEPTKT